MLIFLILTKKGNMRQIVPRYIKSVKGNKLKGKFSFGVERPVQITEDLLPAVPIKFYLPLEIPADVEKEEWIEMLAESLKKDFKRVVDE